MIPRRRLSNRATFGLVSVHFTAASLCIKTEWVELSGMQALTGVIQRSSAQTMMGLDAELQEAAAALQACNPTAISLKAGCELFLRYATRTSALESEDFQTARARIIQVPFNPPSPARTRRVSLPSLTLSGCPAGIHYGCTGRPL